MVTHLNEGEPDDRNRRAVGAFQPLRNGKNDKVSVASAYGIGQLMPDTVTYVNQQLLGVSLDPRRPEHNIRIAARYLRWLLDQTNGYVPTAVAGYYQGLASVRRIGMLADTRFYVASVLALQPRFR